MEKNSYPLYYGGKHMPWAKGTVVKDAKGFIWLAGSEGRDPQSPGLEVVEGAEAQAKMCWEKIKSRLEEMGSSLDNMLKVTTYVVGPFPEGVADSPTWKAARRVREAFFQQHCPDLCSDKNPPASDLIGVAALADKKMLIEVAVVAAIPND
jgi:enamine deaminase RidA (YjgF/YER057c/UK114 family)